MMEIEKAIKVFEAEKNCWEHTCSDCGKGCGLEKSRKIMSYSNARDFALAALREKLERDNGCIWKQEDIDGSTWHCSECGECWTLEADNPFDNDMKFCPGCGKPIHSITFREFDEGEDAEIIDKIVTRDEYGQRLEAQK
jgi:hypothetical protein